MHYELKGIIFKDKAIITELKEHGFNEPIWKADNALSPAAEAGTYIEATLVPNYGLEKNPKKSPGCWTLYPSYVQNPSWFRKEHKKMFRIAADNWWSEHVLVHKEITHLCSGFYYLKDCRVKKVCGDARIICEDSRIDSVGDTACILKACGCSFINQLQNQARLVHLENNSVIYTAGNSSYIEYVSYYAMIHQLKDHAQVKYMRGHSRIRQAGGHSRISMMQDEAIIHALTKNAVVDEMQDLSFVAELADNAKIKEIYSGHAVIPVPKSDSFMPFN